MKNIYYLALICFIALLNSCAISIPTTKYQNQPYINEVDFLTHEYKVVKDVESTTKQVYVLGIGGFKDRHKNAVEELYKQNHINKNQQLVNITTKGFVNLILGGIVTIKKTTAKGTIIEIGNTFAHHNIDNNHKDTISHKITAEVKEETNTISIIKNPVEINPKWKKFTKDLANDYNSGKKIEPIFDLDDDSIITYKELDTIDKIFTSCAKVATSSQDAYNMLIRKLNKQRILSSYK